MKASKFFKLQRRRAEQEAAVVPTPVIEEPVIEEPVVVPEPVVVESETPVLNEAEEEIKPKPKIRKSRRKTTSDN